MSSDNNALFVGIAGVVLGALALLIHYKNYRLQAKKNKPNYMLCTFIEDRTQIRKIRLVHPNETLKGCQILFNDKALIWDTTGTDTFTIESGGGDNAVVPDNIYNHDGIVKIKASGEVIESINFSKIEVCR